MTWDDDGCPGRGPSRGGGRAGPRGQPGLGRAWESVARQRHDHDAGGREILQFWVTDPGVQQALIQDDPDTFWVHHQFATPSVEAWLDRLDRTTVREVLVESWTARATATLRKAHPDLG